MSNQYNVYHNSRDLDYIVCADNETEAIDNVMNHRDDQGQEDIIREGFDAYLIEYDCNGVYDVVTG